MNILAIETSCDETSASVVTDGTKILSNVIATSQAMHEKWGGIVPEVAAREQLNSIIPVLIESLVPFSSTGPANTRQNLIPFKQVIETHIDTIAVTVGPGLNGSLLIGIEVAKTIAMITGKPLIPVNHVLAHMYANFLELDSVQENSKVKGQRSKVNNSIIRISNLESQTSNIEPRISNLESRTSITFPAISLVVSGGHTELFLMTSPKDLKWLGGTIDDAAGEAFDKTARLLGFGSRGGLAIQEAALLVNRSSSIVHRQKEKLPHEQRLTNNGLPITIPRLPRPLLHEDTLNFSFSGLKTAAMREWQKFQQSTTYNPQLVNFFAYEIQEAITDVLVSKTITAAEKYQAKSILLSGGVASNLRLREKFELSMNHEPSTMNFFVPPVSLCTDNAAYIASYAFFRGTPEDWRTLDAQPDLTVEV